MGIQQCGFLVQHDLGAEYDVQLVRFGMIPKQREVQTAQVLLWMGCQVARIYEEHCTELSDSNPLDTPKLHRIWILGNSTSMYLDRLKSNLTLYEDSRVVKICSQP